MTTVYNIMTENIFLGIKKIKSVLVKMMKVFKINLSKDLSLPLLMDC